MRELKKSEKNLLLAVIISLFVIFYGRVKKDGEARITIIKREISDYSERLNKTKQLLAIPITPLKETPDTNSITMTLLENLSISSQVSKVEITSVVKQSETNFQINCTGRFSELMRYLSYLERSDGAFKVETLKLKKSSQTEQPESPESKIEGVINISKRS